MICGILAKDKAKFQNARIFAERKAKKNNYYLRYL